MQFGIKHDRSPYRSASITTVVREFARHELRFSGCVGGYVPKRRHCKSRGLFFFYGKGKENHQLKKDFFVRHRIVSAGKRAAFVSDRTSERSLV